MRDSWLPALRTLSHQRAARRSSSPLMYVITQHIRLETDVSVGI